MVASTAFCLVILVSGKHACPLAGSEKELALGYITFQQDVFLRKLQASDGSWLAEDTLNLRATTGY